VGEALFWGCNVGDHDPRLPECAVPRKPKGVGGGGRRVVVCLVGQFICSCQLPSRVQVPPPPLPPPSLPLAWDCVVEMTGVFV
jgi:hypothetical protein